MFKLIRNYIFWAYERGSFHYDIMVTAILVFMFVSPHIIDFKDKPVETVALHELCQKRLATRWPIRKHS